MKLEALKIPMGNYIFVLAEKKMCLMQVECIVVPPVFSAVFNTSKILFGTTLCVLSVVCLSSKLQSDFHAVCCADYPFLLNFGLSSELCF